MYRYKRWEAALLLALALTALWGASSLRRQEALAQKVIRLHVVAHSDSAADQALKLQVRDRILELAEPLLAVSDDREEAADLLQKSLPALQEAAAAEIRQSGYDYAVAAVLQEEEFPLREYDGFALPSGRYLALRITIGEGCGHNWWCVVFPPLCNAAASDLPETAIEAGWESGDVRLITEDGAGYVIRFRAVELWEQLRQKLKK